MCYNKKNRTYLKIDLELTLPAAERCHKSARITIENSRRYDDFIKDYLASCDDVSLFLRLCSAFVLQKKKKKNLNDRISTA